MKEYVTMKEIIIEGFLKSLKIGLEVVLIGILYERIRNHKK